MSSSLDTAALLALAAAIERRDYITREKADAIAAQLRALAATQDATP